MKNSDLPAFPFEHVSEYSDGKVTKFKNYNGLTKREYFAAMAMQALLRKYEASISHGIKPDVSEVKDTCSVAINVADELLKQLES